MRMVRRLHSPLARPPEGCERARLKECRMKLIIAIGLIALGLGTLGVIKDDAAAATSPVQTFAKPDIDWDECYGGGAPSSGALVCGAGSTDDGGAVLLAPNTTYDSWSIVRIPQGSRGA